MKKLSAIASKRSSGTHRRLRSLRAPHRLHPRFLTPGFTLVEMMVALAILLAVMSMVGVIFKSAGKASSLSQALSALHRQERAAASQLKRDLEGCQPGSDNRSHAILAIAGVEVAAFRNPKAAEGQATPIDPTNPPPGSDAYADIHRADVLMFTTDRDIQTYVFRPGSGNPVIELDPTSMVTYGHADIGQLEPDPSRPGHYRFSTTLPIQRIESSTKATLGATLPKLWYQSDMPASTWHLGRRVLRFPTTWANVSAQPAPPNRAEGLAPQNIQILDDGILQGSYDVYWQPFNDSASQKDSLLPTAGQTYGSFFNTDKYLAYRYTYLGQSVLYRYENIPGGPFFMFSNDHWWSNPTSGAPCNASGMLNWTRVDNGATSSPQCAPDPTDLTNPADPTNTTRNIHLQSWDFRNGFYNPAQPNHRTILDPNAPAQAAEHMGSYFLPNCSDFLVEYTYDDPAEVLVTPDSSGNNWHAEPQAPIRWQRVPNGQQMVWSRLSVDPKNYSDPSDPRNRTDPIRWPRALRITIRAWGPGNTLDAPIDQVIVHTFQ